MVDASGAATEVTVVAGDLGSARPPAPPPDSWASGDHGVAIWSLKLAAGARFALPAARAGLNRTLYFFGGNALEVSGTRVAQGHAIDLVPDRETPLVGSAGPVELLLLQGEPIGEPVAIGGPFVMNTRQEIEQAYADYRRTGFGGWPWPRRDHVHPRQEGRFARHVDGRLERP
jgi:hypothetical protein